MKNYVFHQVIGSRFEVIVASGKLAPSTYNLKPVFTGGKEL